MFKSIIFFSALILLATACRELNEGEETNKSQLQLEEYFFPTDSLVPFIYAYADVNRPVDEKFYRIYSLKSEEENLLIIERFNYNFRITEGYSLDLDDDMKVVDHMVVDGQGTKRKANLTKVDLFPFTENDVAHFVSDFPAPVDSMTAIYSSEKEFLETIQYSILDYSGSAVKVKDEVVLSFVSPSTQKGASEGVTIEKIYAKGLGLTEWYTEDKKVHYKLKAILSNEWWVNNAQ